MIWQSFIGWCKTCVCVCVCNGIKYTLFQVYVSSHSKLVGPTQQWVRKSIYPKQVILPRIMELTEIILKKINIFHLSYLLSRQCKKKKRMWNLSLWLQQTFQWIIEWTREIIWDYMVMFYENSSSLVTIKGNGIFIFI